MLYKIQERLSIEWAFWNQDDVGITRKTSAQGDPACCPPHRLDHDDSPVRVCGRAKSIDGLGDDGTGGIVSKGNVGAREVVVDGFGYSYERNRLLKGFQARKRTVTARDHKAIQAKLLVL